MKTSSLKIIGFVCAAVLAFAAAQSAIAGNANPLTVDITVHEDGTGTFMNSNGVNQPLVSAQQQDPGPGGLANALTFGLLSAPGLVAGDLFLIDPVTMALSDVIRFNPTELIPGQSPGDLVFYSIAGGGQLADTGFPSANYANTFSLIENPLGATVYTPTAGQPGFIAVVPGAATYHIFSEEIAASGVPETGGTMAFMGLALLALIPLGRWRLATRS
jgi:hypothetical protein